MDWYRLAVDEDIIAYKLLYRYATVDKKIVSSSHDINSDDSIYINYNTNKKDNTLL